MFKKSAEENTSQIKKNEFGFSFPLPMVVEGISSSGRPFRENTVLSFISHKGSSFNLQNPVTLGSKLKLIIDLPEKLAEDRNLKLVIRGKAVLIEAVAGKSPHQRISLKLENRYLIKEEKEALPGRGMT